LIYCLYMRDSGSTLEINEREGKSIMKLSNTKKVSLGILSFWPLVYILFFMVVMHSIILAEPAGTSADSLFFRAFLVIIPLHFLTILVVIGLTIFYLAYIINTDLIPKNQKLTWVIALFFLNILAIPSFWYLYLWREPQPGAEPHILKFIWYLLLSILAAIAIYALFFIEIEFMGTVQKIAVVLLAVILFAYIYKYKIRVKAGS